MSKRKPKDEQPAPNDGPHNSGTRKARKPQSEKPAAPDGPRVLTVDPCAGTCLEVQKALAALGVTCDVAASLKETRTAIAAREYDLIIVDEDQTDGNGLDLVRELAGHDHPARCIVTSLRGDFEGVVNVMRSGAIDFIAKPYRAAEIAGRVLSAIEVGRRLRASERRVKRLKRICKRLNNERDEVCKQMDVLCNDLVHAYQELADQMSSATLANEFSALVRQDLDVEDLLRTTLEYLLGKTGPTNAAVFLPTGSHDFNLGAYVNYDVPRDTADVLLDHLSDVIAPRFENEPDIIRLSSSRDLVDRLGEGASWLSDYGVTIFSCRQDGECLAVVALFRDRKNQFNDELIEQLTVLRDIFAEQLARVVRIHHRHKPHLQWPGFDVEDDRGMAA